MQNSQALEKWFGVKQKQKVKINCIIQQLSIVIKLKKKKEKLEKDLEESLIARRNFAQIRANEKISKLEEEQKTNFYSHKELLLNDLIEEIEEKLENYTKTDEYKYNLKESIDKTIDSLKEDPNDYLILVKKSDANYLDYPNLSYMDDKYLGGFILKSTKGNYQYNKTYLKRIKDKKYEIGKTLYKLIERESFNESNN